jgi:hypothetical protein
VTAQATDPGSLLSTVQVAEFVARGFLRFDGLVPDSLNEIALAELSGDPTAGGDTPPALPRKRYAPGSALSDCFGASPGIGTVLRLPAVRGILESLVGPRPRYDHHAVHVRRAGEASQPLHADAIIDTRATFDVQLMYYPQTVTARGGGTLLVPGSHFRQVNEQDIARYQNLAGQVLLECPAGTVLALHHGLWHCGRRSYSDTPRYMFKVRVNPSVPQVRLWDTADLEQAAVLDQVRAILARPEPWFEGAAARLEQVQRTALFRRMSGDPAFQLEYWLGRLENQASPRLREILP